MGAANSISSNSNISVDISELSGPHKKGLSDIAEISRKIKETKLYTDGIKLTNQILNIMQQHRKMSRKIQQLRQMVKTMVNYNFKKLQQRIVLLIINKMT
jgi:pyridoxal biosynthesis lyase PdxS